MDESTHVKTCLKCGTPKPISEFSEHPHGSFGKHPRCRDCLRTDRRERRERLGDKIRAEEAARRSTPEFRAAKAEYNRAYRIENRDRLRAADSVYYRENLDRRRTYAAEWQRLNPEKLTEYKRRWRQSNPDAVVNDRHIRRARRARVEGRNVDLRSIWTGRCALCNDFIDDSLKFPEPMSKSLDHIVPLSKGGRHVQENVQWVHLICNCLKSNTV